MLSRTSRLIVLVGVCVLALFAGGCGSTDKKASTQADATSATSQASSSKPDYASYATDLGLSVQTLKRLNDESGLEPSSMKDCSAGLYPYDANDGDSADDTRYYIHCVREIPEWNEACVVQDSPDIASDYEKATGLDVCELLREARSCRNGENKCDTGNAMSDYLWVPDEKLDL